MFCGSDTFRIQGPKVLDWISFGLSGLGSGQNPYCHRHHHHHPLVGEKEEGGISGRPCGCGWVVLWLSIRTCLFSASRCWPRPPARFSLGHLSGRFGCTIFPRYVPPCCGVSAFGLIELLPLGALRLLRLPSTDGRGEERGGPVVASLAALERAVC